MKPHFTGTYDLVPIPMQDCRRRKLPCHWWSRPLYDFTLDPIDPLTFHSGDGLEIQPCRAFVTDLGSIPEVVQLLIPALDRARYARSYLFHDSAYVKHLAWARYSPKLPFARLQVTRQWADGYLRAMLLAEGAWQATAQTVYAGVRAGGMFAW